MKIIYKKLNDITPYLNNPRDNDSAAPYVANSIRSFGFRVPIVIDKENVIICGHTRYKAAQILGLSEVPCVMADSLTEDQAKAFRIVDNKTQEASKWDYGKLDQELNAIMDFDMEDFGFGSGEEKERVQQVPDGEEIDLGDFDDEAFGIICPCCGFAYDE